MKRKKTKSNLWKYLEETGVLVTGDDEQIKSAKKEYWRIYDREYKKNKRKEKRSYLISLSILEADLISFKAKKFDLDVQSYIKDCVMENIKLIPILPSKILIKEIHQFLSLLRNDIKRIHEKDNKTWWGANKDYEILENKIIDIEKKVSELLLVRPSILESLKTIFRDYPSFILELKAFINNYDNQKSHEKIE